MAQTHKKADSPLTGNYGHELSRVAHARQNAEAALHTGALNLLKHKAVFYIIAH